MSASTGILWACKILYLIIKEQVLLWYLEVYLYYYGHIRIPWYFFNLYFNYCVQFLELQGPLSFFDYAVFCEIEILIETRAVLLFLAKKSNNLWSPSYMQDLIKSLMESPTQPVLKHSYFSYMRSVSSALEARQRYLLCMVGFSVCLCKNPKHWQAFLLQGRLHDAPWFSSGLLATFEFLLIWHHSPSTLNWCLG